MSRYVKYLFTVNNYTDADVASLKATNPALVRHLVVGKEIAPTTGTSHLQCYVHLLSGKTISAVKTFIEIDNAHFDPVTKDNGAADYCKKGGDFFEIGTPVVSQQGKRNDILDCEAFMVENPTASLAEVYSAFPKVAARSGKWIRERLQQLQPIPQRTLPELREWQATLFNDLQQDPHPRRIYVFVDPVGGAGKTAFYEHLAATLPGVEYFRSAKPADLAFHLNRPRIAIFDFVRSTEGYNPWSFVEQVKDGLVFSPKYESGLKRFPQPHVVVFSNSSLPPDCLSADRVHEVRLSTLVPTSGI